MRARLLLENADSDRRQAVRQCALPITIMVDRPDRDRIQATLIDISRSGVRLCSAEPIGLGSEILLVGPAGSGLAPLRARVVRRNQVDDASGKQFDYGAAFADPLGEERHIWFLALRKAA